VRSASVSGFVVWDGSAVYLVRMYLVPKMARHK
jgi:hypothetical protein